MAFIRNPADPMKQSGTQQSGVIDSSGQQSSSEYGRKSPTSNWTNLQSYIDANQGQGGAIADKMLTSGNQALGNVEQAGKQFADEAAKQIEAGTKKDTNNFAGTFGQASSLTDDQKGAYNAWAQAPAYSGPKTYADVSNYGDLSKASENLSSQAKSLGTQSGQQAAAMKNIGAGYGNYNAGMGMLDALLAKQAGGAGNLQAFQDKAAQAEQNRMALTGDVSRAIQGGMATGEAAQRSASEALRGLETRQAAEQARIAQEQARIAAERDRAWQMQQANKGIGSGTPVAKQTAAQAKSSTPWNQDTQSATKAAGNLVSQQATKASERRPDEKITNQDALDIMQANRDPIKAMRKFSKKIRV